MGPATPLTPGAQGGWAPGARGSFQRRAAAPSVRGGLCGPPWRQARFSSAKTAPNPKAMASPCSAIKPMLDRISLVTPSKASVSRALTFSDPGLQSL